MYILNDHNINVNENLNDFLEFIKEDSKNDPERIVNSYLSQNKQSRVQKPKPYDIRYQSFFDRVPEILTISVIWTIKNRYENNYENYIKACNIFTEKFFYTEKNFCDNENSERRKVKKMLLWACQLLKLVGNRQAFNCPKALFDEYELYLERQTDYCNSAKLLNIKGELVKMTTPAFRKQKVSAKNMRIVRTLEQIAKDKDFTFSFITLTLPPVFHCNPTQGKNSYKGATPQQALNELNSYWKRIRAIWSKNGLIAKDDFFGVEVSETQKDSTLHKHVLVWHKKDDSKIIHNAVKTVQEIESKKYNMKKPLQFDIKLNDGRAKASSYLFKYINKSITNGIYTPSKDEACLSYYGARAFNFFGMDRSIGKFDFLCEHYKSYVDYLPEEVTNMLEKRDLYKFLTIYSKDFKKISQERTSKEKKVFLGYSFKNNNKKIVFIKTQFILIENIEMEEAQKEELDYIKDYAKYIIAKNNRFVDCLNVWTSNEIKKGNNILEVEENKININITEDELKGLIEDNYYNFFDKVTVNHRYSRVSAKAEPLNEENILNIYKIPEFS